jgi:hypothetical protein
MYPAYPPQYVAPPPVVPSAPPLPPPSVQGQTNDSTAFAVSCVALGIFALIAGIVIDSPILFVGGLVSIVVGLVALPTPSFSSLNIHLGPSPGFFHSHSWVPSFFHPSFYSRRPPRPIFVNQAPIHHSPPPYPGSGVRVGVGNGGTIFD